jgi:catechol 2,3-dioxygenase-like lactoylglutathione lyase family enzyme
MVRTILCFLILGSGAFGEELPLLGLAHVAVRVSDIGKARAFYHGVLGFDEVFDFKAPDGSLAMAFFKVNDDQYVEVFPGIRPNDKILMTHIGILTSDIQKLHKMLEDRGLAPTAVKMGPRDHAYNFTIRNPPGQRLQFLEFMQYLPGSVYRENKGKALSERRISTRLEHAGIITTDLQAARSFYVDKMGFKETWNRKRDDGSILLMHLRMPGPSGDYVELSVRPPDAVLSKQQAGMAAHFSLEVPDIKAAYKLSLDRGLTENRKDPRFGLDERWQFNLFDPDFTRVECMQPRAKKDSQR